MTRGKQTTALALAGAIALASGAYALGSQTDDGNAAAAKTPSGHRFAGGPGGPGFAGRPGLDGLANKLGVSEDKLRSALEAIAKEHRDGFASELASALGVDRAKVEQAFQNLRPKRPPEPRRPRAVAAALAKELGISVAKVRAAFENHRAHPTDPATLAKELGVTEEKLRDAFHATMGRILPHGPGHRPGFTGLAKALGVTQAQLDAAFEKLRANHEKVREQFVAELAAKLGIDAAKVQDALGDVHPFGFGGHRHP
jgi:methylphosphotriester-DNA--protein-cysteine methyltransferase